MKGMFHIKEYCGEGQYRPESKHTFGMYLNDKWYILTAHGDIYDPNDPVDQLDVSILQKNVLDPLLGIKDPRTDSRIDFIGGNPRSGRAGEESPRGHEGGFRYVSHLHRGADQHRRRPARSCLPSPLGLSPS